jgi:predicted ABC-type ATPase
MHIARVRERVASGGHDIPEAMIRERWESSRRNLVILMPRLTELRVFDNSNGRDSVSGKIPPPRIVMHVESGVIIEPSLSELESTPEWAKPIVACLLRKL